jgi:hypothetical protein
MTRGHRKRIIDLSLPNFIFPDFTASTPNDGSDGGGVLKSSISLALALVKWTFFKQACSNATGNTAQLKVCLLTNYTANSTVSTKTPTLLHPKYALVHDGKSAIGLLSLLLFDADKVHFSPSHESLGRWHDLQHISNNASAQHVYDGNQLYKVSPKPRTKASNGDPI